MKLNTIKFECEYSFWQDLFSDEELNSIIEYCEKQEKVPALIGTDNSAGKLDTNTRKTDIAWIRRNIDNDWFFSRIEAAGNKLNSKFFGFDIETLQIIQYTIYEEEGSHYNWHWDCYVGNKLDNLEVNVQRKLTGVIQLSDASEYEGGNLELLPCGTLNTIEKKKGLSIFFPSFLLHRVEPVTKGSRKTLVVWFTGPDWK